MSQTSQKRIIIVGGGSAGWITAGLLASRFAADSNFAFTLVESPNVATIGVGEGTWPSMRETLRKIGLSETDFMLHCSASFKQGSTFKGWNTGEDGDQYHHPFSVPSGYSQTDVHKLWQHKSAGNTYANCVSPQSIICDEGLAPKQYQTPEYAGVLNYGYHFDADKFVEMLTEHCIQTLNVQHIVGHVEHIQQYPNNAIEAIQLDGGQTIHGDLFIDCTGSRGLLIEKTCGAKWLSQRGVLFNDSALALRVPHDSATAPIASTTVATAHQSGWIWDIGLSSRRGIGCVFSSQHCDEQQAKSALAEYIASTAHIGAIDVNEARLLSFDPGYRDESWRYNCVAVGMSSGFIEPLEASALAMVELSVTLLADNLNAAMHAMPVVRDRFNARTRYRWERVIEFVKLHYVLSQRKDSAYWREHRDVHSIPQRLQDSLQLWQYQPPSRHDLEQNEEVFPSASYQYILYGMGFLTESAAYRDEHNMQGLWNKMSQDNRQYVSKLKQGLPSNRQWLDRVLSGPLADIG